MKNQFLLTIGLLALTILISGCKENPTAFSFTEDYVTTTITIHPTTASGDMIFTSEEIETDIQGIASANGISIDNLNSAKVKSVTLTLIDNNPTPYTFDLLSKVESKIGRTTDGTLITFAKKDLIPSTGLSNLSLDVNDLELLDYFKKTKLKFELSGHTNAPIDQVFQIQVEMSVRFEGEVIK